MSVDERLAGTDFPLPAIRQVNMAKHPDAIGLGLGELKDFPVDARVIQAFNQSLNTSGANYAPNAGVVELRELIAKKQHEHDGFEYTANNVVITIGVQNALYVAIKTLAKLGAKRVLIPKINFGIYKKIPAEFNLDVQTYPLTDDFGIEISALDKLLQPDDLIIINSPANPTGRVLSKNEMTRLGQLFTQRLSEGYVISDEIYGKLVYEGEACKSFSAFFSRTIVLDGISKSAATAGFRVGWAITANAKLAKALTSNNATLISCPPTPNQMAAIPVVAGETQQSITNYNRILLQNRDIVISALKNAGISFVKPTGSFYIFPFIGDLISCSVKEFCLKTAHDENGVVVIPGEAFGAPRHVRISLASMQIEEGINRFIKAVIANR